MYKSVIDIRKDVSESKLNQLLKMADRAFDNRVGKVQNMSKIPYQLSYEGEEAMFGCLELGMLALEEANDFLPYVEAWKWIDEEEPGENCDILAEMISYRSK